MYIYLCVYKQSKEDTNGSLFALPRTGQKTDIEYLDTMAQSRNGRSTGLEKVLFGVDTLPDHFHALVIGRNRSERIRLLAHLLQKRSAVSAAASSSSSATVAPTDSLRAAVIISSMPQILEKELQPLIPAGLPVHIIPSNVAGAVMPLVIDYLVTNAKTGFETAGVAREHFPVAVVFDCTEADYARILKRSVFYRDLMFHNRHFDISTIVLSTFVPEVITPDIRSNIDYVFAFAEPSVDQRKRLFKGYYRVFEHLSEFCDCFERYVQSGNEAFVINNRIRTNNKWHMLSVCEVPSLSDLEEVRKKGDAATTQQHEDTVVAAAPTDGLTVLNGLAKLIQTATTPTVRRHHHHRNKDNNDDNDENAADSRSAAAESSSSSSISVAPNDHEKTE